MSEQLPRWIAIVIATMTVVVGMLGAAVVSSGWLVYEQPYAVRDGQYVMGVGLLTAAGFWGALPAGILSGVLVYRDTRLFGAFALAVGGVGALAVGVGVLLSGLSAGWEGVLAALIVLLASPIGLVVAPLMLLKPDTYSVAVATGVCLVLVVLVTYRVYRLRRSM